MNTKAIFKSVATFALGAVTCLGVITSGFTDWSVPEKQVQRIEESASFIGDVFEGDGFTLAMARAESNEGISTVAETNYTLTATVTTSGTVLDSGVNWSIAWSNAGSTWAKGKSVSDYVTISSSGLSCTVSNSQAFGEPIIVTATSRQNTSKKAACRLDYVKRVVGMSNDYYERQAENNGDCEIYIGQTNYFMADVEFGVGTITPSVEISGGRLQFDDLYFDQVIGDYVHITSNDISFDEGLATMISHNYNAESQQVCVAFTMGDWVIDDQDADLIYECLSEQGCFGFSVEFTVTYNGVKYQNRNYIYIRDNGGYLFGGQNSPSRISDVSLSNASIVL